jgi:hypothetical protein
MNLPPFICSSRTKGLTGSGFFLVCVHTGFKDFARIEWMRQRNRCIEEKIPKGIFIFNGKQTNGPVLLRRAGMQPSLLS